MSRTMITLNTDDASVPSEVFDDPTLDVTLQLEKDGIECDNCGEAIVHYVHGWEHEDSIGSPDLCGTYDWDDVRIDLELDEQQALNADTAPEILSGTEYTLATPAPDSPADFVNWIGATVHSDRVAVQISLGDPRGCLAMTAWRGHDADGNPVTYLSVPQADDSAPHVALTEIRPGTFRVG